MDDLTPQQQQFVIAYVVGGGNATRAALAAGFSPKSARSIGSHLLDKPHVRRAIRAEQERTLQCRLASKALTVLEDVMVDKEAPAGARVDACKALLGMAVIITPRVPSQAVVPGLDKPLNECDVAHLRAVVAALETIQAECEQGVPTLN